MSTATKIFCALTVALLLSASSANAAWIGGVRTWPGTSAAPVQPPHSGTSIQYMPFISDYGSYWGQDNYDTVVSYFNSPAGQVVAESCWQSWTGSAVDCPNPASTTAYGYHSEYIEGFGYLGPASAWDYFYVEFIPYSLASFEVNGVAWEP